MERFITKKTKNFLTQLRKKGFPIYFNKISDRFTSGIPDVVGVCKGKAFYIELKDFGKKPRLLQAWQLKQVDKAGGATLATDDFCEVEKFIFDLLEN